MTDAQIVAGIKSNDDKTWRYIYRSMKKSFYSTIAKAPESCILSSDEVEDIFQEVCILLMDAVKKDKFKVMDGSHIFSWLVTTGRFKVMNMARASKSRSKSAPKQDANTPHIISLYRPEQTGNEEYQITDGFIKLSGVAWLHVYLFKNKCPRHICWFSDNFRVHQIT